MPCTSRCCTSRWGPRGGCSSTSASAEEAGYGARAGEIAAQLAVHFERGGEPSQAVHYWQKVAEIAARRKAYHEAIAALRKGLASLATLPDSPERIQRELALQLTLGELFSAVRGRMAPEVGEAYMRAYALCQEVGETPWLFEVLWGLTVFVIASKRSCVPLAGSARSSSTWRNASMTPSSCTGAIMPWGCIPSLRVTSALPVSTWKNVYASVTPHSLLPPSSTLCMIEECTPSAFWRIRCGCWAMQTRPSSGVRRRWPWPSRESFPRSSECARLCSRAPPVAPRGDGHALACRSLNDPCR